MDDNEKTRSALLTEVLELRRRVAELETAETGHKQTEEDLYQSRTMLQLVLDTIPQRVFWKGRDYFFLGCNRPFAKDAGLSDPNLIIGKDDFHLPWKDVAQLYREDDALVMNTDTPKLNFEEPQAKPSGIRRWLRTSKVPLHDRDGMVIGILGTYEDITEGKQMEEAVRESAEKFRLIFEYAFDGISIFEENPDPDRRRLVECNGHYAEMAGRSRQELLSIGHTRDMARTLSKDNTQSIEETVAFRGAFTWIRPDGKDNIIEYTAVPIKMQGKTFTIGIDRDVTEQRHAEAEREKLIADLQSALADVKMLSGLVPICANCKKIRDDKGYWTQLEGYIQDRSEARFSHGICPDCMIKLYPEYQRNKKE